MKKNIAIKYNIRDKVYIKELKITGRVVSVWLTEHGLKYEVRYFDHAKVQSVYFYEDELSIKK